MSLGSSRPVVFNHRSPHVSGLQLAWSLLAKLAGKDGSCNQEHLGIFQKPHMEEQFENKTWEHGLVVKVYKDFYFLVAGVHQISCSTGSLVF